MTVFIDTSVIMYAAGAAHPHRAACREVVSQIAAGDLDGVTSSEVVQEILHRFGRGRRELGERMARDVLDLFGDLLPVDGRVAQAALRLYGDIPSLSARDVLHVATCTVNGVRRIVSVDTGFDQTDEVQRVDPADLLGSGTAERPE